MLDTMRLRSPFILRSRGPSPVMDISFLSGLDPRITFTRASTATYFDSAGVMQIAGVDTPRFDYDPVTLAPLGLRMDESRTNLLLHSADLSNVAWGKNGTTTVSADGSVAPDGTTTMDKIVEGVGASSYFVSQVPSLAASTQYCMSAYAKPDGRNWLQLRFRDKAGALHRAWFNISTGAVGGTAGSVVSRAIQNTPQGYRCIAVFASGTGAGATDVGCQISDADLSTGHTGNGVSGVYLWGAQLEAGAYPTAYIPTTTASVTRAAGNALMTAANFSSWFNQSEGTIVVEFSTITNGLTATGTNAFPFIYDLDSAGATTSGHSLIASAGYGPGIRAQTQVSGVSQAELTSAQALGGGTILRHAFAYKGNDFAACLNGGTVLTDVSGTLPSPDRLSIGSQDAGGSNPFTGHIRRLQLYKTRLPNAVLPGLLA
jgi:hypothetical protein